MATAAGAAGGVGFDDLAVSSFFDISNLLSICDDGFRSGFYSEQ